jgi:hypothetical protein
LRQIQAHGPGRGHPRVASGLTPFARDDLRRVLIRDQPDCDAIASDLLRYRDEARRRLGDIIDMLTMHPEARRRVVRMLGEMSVRGEG